MAKAVTEGDLVAAAVLSGNRNFEGRINPLVKANYLASPPLVVAYALAGTTDIDLVNEPLGNGTRRQAGLSEGHLADAAEEVARRDRGMRAARDVPAAVLRTCSTANEQWNEIPVGRAATCIDVGRQEHLHPGAAVLGRSAARRRADPADPAARACWRCWATR